MQLKAVQKIELFLLRQLINLLWLFDLGTGYPINSSITFALKPLVLFSIVIIFGSFSFIYRTQSPIAYLKNISVYNQPVKVAVVPNNSDTPVVLGVSKENPSPEKKADVEFPIVTAKSVLVADKTTGKYLYDYNKSLKLASASTTKLMTALVSLNLYSLDDVLVVPKDCTELDSTKAGLPAGEKFTVESLLNSMLIYSAGDAACVLGSAKIDDNEFLYLMNEKAFELGMKHTFFTNTIGLDGINGAHFSSAEDLYMLAKAAMEKPVLSEIVKKQEYTFTSVDQSFSAKLDNTNVLLKEIPNSVGIKTGTTQEAGEVLIYEYKEGKKDIIIVVMGSTDRFNETKAILKWVLDSYNWE